MCSGCTTPGVLIQDFNRGYGYGAASALDGLNSRHLFIGWFLILRTCNMHSGKRLHEAGTETFGTGTSGTDVHDIGDFDGETLTTSEESSIWSDSGQTGGASPLHLL